MRKQIIITFVVSVLLVLFLSSCSEANNGITVWTDYTTYADYQASFGSLGDEMYIRYEFSASEWKTISPTLTNEGKHSWSRDQIKNWFIGRGFGEYESNKEIAWLSTIDHGFIASRSGNIVYMLMK